MADDDKEQQLREKIATQKSSIADLPSLHSIFNETGPASPETKARAQLIKELSDNEEQLEILIESKRVAAVVHLQDELHPPIYSEDCPICLETIKHVNSYTAVRLHCCGGWICRQCVDEREANCKRDGFDEGYRNKCPFCREEIRKDDSQKIRAKVLEHANKGRAWAQTKIGNCYSNEMVGKKYGIPFDKEKGLHFLKQAADQRYSDALYEMAMSFFPPERDEPKHIHYMKEAADLGHPLAQNALGDAYKRQKDDKGRLHYITLAASQGDADACNKLGSLFMSGKSGLSKSLILAKHYYGKSLKDTETLYESQYQYFAYSFSIALYQLSCEHYEILEIPGHSPIPKTLFWLRKALESDSLTTMWTNSVKKQLSQLENKAKSHCANC